MNPLDNFGLHLTVTYMVVILHDLIENKSWKNTRKTLKTQPYARFRNTSIRP
jgi:hypothetical protein